MAALTLTGCGGADVGKVVGTLLIEAPIAVLTHKLAEQPPPAGSVHVLAYDVFVADAFLHWHECTDKTTCGHVERSRRFSSLISMKRVGSASVDGREVDVLRLEFPPPPSP